MQKMSAISLVNRCYFNKIRPLQSAVLVHVLNGPYYEQRCTITKHWNPKFKWLRQMKVIKVDLPKYHEKKDHSEQERKRMMRERGVKPARPWVERPFSLSCTSDTFEPYVPPEGDGKRSVFSKAGAKQNIEFLEKKSKSMMAVRKIRTYDEDFDPKAFAVKAQEIYVEAHEVLAKGDKLRLRDLVTERAYPEMRHNSLRKTIRWKFLQSLEPPRVVHARQTHLLSKENIFAQITVRFHTQQTLAIYDRFGRLMHGSEIIAKDVLEYVVFENNVSNVYGTWRLHNKIIPDWAEQPQPRAITWVVREDEGGEEEKEAKADVAQTQEAAVESVQTVGGESKATTPPLATA